MDPEWGVVGVPPPPPLFLILILGKEVILTPAQESTVITGIRQISLHSLRWLVLSKTKIWQLLSVSLKWEHDLVLGNNHLVIFFITSMPWWTNKNLKVINWISFSQPKPYSNTHFYQDSKGAINWGILKNWDLIQSMIWRGFSGNNKLGLLRPGTIPTFYFAHTTGPSKFSCKRQGYSVRSKIMLN